MVQLSADIAAEISMTSFDARSQSAPVALVSVVFRTATAAIIVAALYGVDLVVGQIVNSSWMNRP